MSAALWIAGYVIGALIVGRILYVYARGLLAAPFVALPIVATVFFWRVYGWRIALLFWGLLLAVFGPIWLGLWLLGELHG